MSSGIVTATDLYDDPTQLDPLDTRHALEKGHKAFMEFLYKSEYPLLQELLAEIEKNTGIERHKLAYGLFAILPLYLLVGRYAGLVCNFLTFVYPAFATIAAVRSTSQAQRDGIVEYDIQWLVYWTVYGIFAILDHAPFHLADNVQLYWLFKAVGLFYLSLPEVKIAAKIFLYKVEPWVVKVEKLIERPKKEKDVVSKGGKEVASKGGKEVATKGGGKEVASKGSKSKNK
uniref:Receptor expression-enhancing protein n=1 Tax=Meloidogyne hapla TaxID=6305 RepID=A0A1I8BCG8_MELHA